MIETNGIDHIVLRVADVPRARDFYSGVPGMTVYREDER
jgi:catechol 2,3-dioxygenase-like lactoylglutathione lyase family enzyme